MHHLAHEVLGLESGRGLANLRIAEREYDLRPFRQCDRRRIVDVIPNEVPRVCRHPEPVHRPVHPASYGLAADCRSWIRICDTPSGICHLADRNGIGPFGRIMQLQPTDAVLPKVKQSRRNLHRAGRGHSKLFVIVWIAANRHVPICADIRMGEQCRHTGKRRNCRKTHHLSLHVAIRSAARQTASLEKRRRTLYHIKKSLRQLRRDAFRTSFYQRYHA